MYRYALPPVVLFVVLVGVLGVGVGAAADSPGELDSKLNEVETELSAEQLAETEPQPVGFGMSRPEVLQEINTAIEQANPFSQQFERFRDIVRQSLLATMATAATVIVSVSARLGFALSGVLPETVVTRGAQLVALLGCVGAFGIKILHLKQLWRAA